MLGGGKAAFASELRAEKDSRTSARNPIPTRNVTQLKGYLKFEGMSYPTEIPGSPQLSQSLNLIASINIKRRSERVLSEADLYFSKYIDLGPSSMAVSQIYSSASWNNSQTRGAIGRKIEYWSELDHNWQLGLWQPQYRPDSLRPEEQGLTGFFLKQDLGFGELLGYFSPIFIPTMGPEIQEKNGNLVADNRWYRSPSSSFPLFGKDTKLAYDLDIPHLSDLVAKPGGGLRLRTSEGLGYWASGNFAYKPINSLLLKYKTNLYLPEVDPATGEVTISPSVGYHNLWGIDFGHRGNSRNVSISYLEDRPEVRFAQENWVLQSAQPLKAYSLHLDQTVRVPGLKQDAIMALDYLRVFGAGFKDYDNMGQEQGAIFDSRLNFKHAAAFKLSTQGSWKGKSILGSFRYMRELDQKGTWLNAEATMYPKRNLALSLGLDILGTDEPTDEDTSFLNQFRANDRIYGGLSYVF